MLSQVTKQIAYRAEVRIQGQLLFFYHVLLIYFFLIKKKTMGLEHMGKTDLLLLQKLLLVWTDKEKTRYS